MPHCNTRFGKVSAMRTHCANFHEKVRAHKCRYCNMRRHCRAVHEKVCDRACLYGVASGAKQHLARHIDAVHLKLREHACPYCPGVAFGEKGNLTKQTNHVHLKIAYPRRRTKLERVVRQYNGRDSDSAAFDV